MLVLQCFYLFFYSFFIYFFFLIGHCLQAVIVFIPYIFVLAVQEVRILLYACNVRDFPTYGHMTRGPFQKPYHLRARNYHDNAIPAALDMNTKQAYW